MTKPPIYSQRPGKPVLATRDGGPTYAEAVALLRSVIDDLHNLRDAAFRNPARVRTGLIYARARLRRVQRWVEDC